MELRVYLRMLRRGWLLVVLSSAVFLGSAALYLALVPKSYDATAVLFVSADGRRTIDDLQQGATFSSSAVVTYAEIIDSATVLDPVTAELPQQADVQELAAMITASVREETTLIDITATGEDRGQVAMVANTVAASAMRIIPALETTPDGRFLVRMQQIRTAVEPARASSPDIRKILTLGLVLGLCVGLGLSVTRQALDTRIRGVDDLHELTEVPLLGVLPSLEGTVQGLVVRNDPTGGAGEAFRALRTNARLLEETGRQSFVVTAVADDGNDARVSANVAWSLAQAGHNVLLVDCDLRCSPLQETLGIQAGPGLADVLAGKADLSAVTHGTDHPQLRVVLAGTARPHPSDLLSSSVLPGLVTWMEQSYDTVILHAPPLMSSIDAAVVAGAAGGTFVTVAVGRDGAGELATALSVLANVRVTPRGLVLTRPGRGTRSRQAVGVDWTPHTTTAPELVAASRGPSRGRPAGLGTEHRRHRAT